MLVSTAHRIGLRVGVYGSDETREEMKLADFKVVGNGWDKEKLQRFAESCDLITYDSERVNLDVIQYLAKFTAVPQGTDMLEIMQDRLLERAFFEQLNVNIAPYATIITLDDIYQSVDSIGYPCILKPIQKDWSTDRQLVIRRQTDIAKAAGLVGQGTYILESLLPFDRELSLLVARGQDGTTQLYPVTEVVTRDGQLHESFVPVDLDANTEQEIQRIGQEVAANVHYAGVFEVAFYLTQNGALYVDKIISAPSSAGYIFSETAAVSEFENHLRAVCGLPLMTTKQLTPAVLVTFKQSQLDAIRTQWLLKDNWHFCFYHLPRPKDDDRIGYIMVETDSVSQTLDKIEDTGLWADDQQEEQPAETD
ncbi:phosphoribosylaminoimidazole carboxylase [Levilactobacillus bambusae]|uniref:Phosphoribosylaminoimidazole carboxylase n=2 Tax=Levilactobacillus bambusae TaxID=2024736 RepID=A0A2V1MZX5_9LACO|nr:phosphoribosylaminoimidazole carboxylase [Levilactobacillus bambusae]